MTTMHTGPAYTPADKRKLLAWLRRIPNADAARPIREACADLEMSDRLVRAIFADVDGFDLVVGYAPGGVFCARTPEDAEAGTAQLESRAAKLRKRSEARRVYFAQLAGQQLGMWSL